MSSTETEHTFLTIAESAQLLRVSVSTIRNRIRDGSLPAKRLKGGQTVLLERKDVLAQLEDARAFVSAEPIEPDEN